MAKKPIYDQKDALSAYFNDMLADSHTRQPIVENKTESPPVSPSLKQNIVFPVEELAVPVDVEISAPTPLPQPSVTQSEVETSLNVTDDKVATEQVQDTDIVTTDAISSDQIQTENAVLKLLLCDIGGIKVAIKVDALDNIIRWPEKDLSYIPGRKSWEVALYNDNGQNTNVIDIRKLLHSPEQTSPLNAHYILLVNDRRTGIACDTIEQIINKNNNEINWRNDTHQRPWFTGVLSETMHSVLDISAIIKALE